MATKRKPRKPVGAEQPTSRDDDDFGDEAPAPAPAAKRPARKNPQDDGGPSVVEKPASRIVRPSNEIVLARQVFDMDAPHRDPKKFNKKQKEVLAKWRGTNHGKMVDAFMRGQLAASRAKRGHNAVLAGHADDSMVIVIPCPLAFEYVLAQDGFPLGVIIHLNGPPGSLKSPLLYEMFRWFRNAGGVGVLEEAETKYSAELLQSVVGYTDDEVNVQVDKCESVEEWQSYLQDNTKMLKTRLVGNQKEPGPGRTIPIAFGVDSIMGKPSIETQEKVREAGHGVRNFPAEALYITQYIKTFAHELDGWPFTLVLNNHLKIGKDDDGNEKKRTGGGVGVNFQESWELETKIRKSKIEASGTDGWTGVVINIRCVKNSFGPTWKGIDTRMLWWEERDERYPETHPKGWKQITRWDWDWALVKLLTTVQGRDGARLKDLGFHIKATKTSDVENAAWCRNLGMEEEDAIPWSDLGAKIRKDNDLVNLIRTGLGIKRRPLLAGDYNNQLEELRQEMP